MSERGCSRFYRMLLVGTALATGGLSAPAFSATIQDGGGGTWGSANSQTSVSVATASAGDNLNFSSGGINVIFRSSAPNNDGGGNNLFTVGNMTHDPGLDSRITVFSGTAGDITLNINSVDVSGFSVTTSGVAGRNATVNVANNFILDTVVDGGSTVTTTSTNIALLKVGGNYSGSDINITATGVTTGTSTLQVAGNLTSTSTLNFNESGTGRAHLLLDGSAKQTVNAVIDVASGSQGTITVTNTSADGVVFTKDVSGTNLIRAIKVGNAATNSKVEFNAGVGTSEGITLGNGDGGVQTITANFIGAQTVRTNINTDTTDTGNIVFSAAGAKITYVGNIGDTSTINDVAVNGASTVVQALGQVNAKTITGGAGTQEFLTNGGDTLLNADITGIENFRVQGPQLFTFKGSVDGGTVHLEGNGNTLTINAATKTIAANVIGTATGGQTATINLTAGTLSGNITLGAANETLNFKGGAFTGTADFGAGTDTLNLDGADATISKAVTGLETLNINGRKLTLSSSITGVTTDVVVGAAGEIAFNSGGSIDRLINGDDGTLNFGSDTLGGTYTLTGGINDAVLKVTSGTLKTNGQLLGSGVAGNRLHNITVSNGAAFQVQSNVFSNNTLRIDGEVSIDQGRTLSVANYNTASTGTIVFEIKNTGGTLTAGLLDMNGGALDLSNSKIKIVVAAGSDAPAAAQTILLTANATGLVLPTAGNISDTYAPLDFTLSVQGGNILLTVPGAAAGGATNTGLTPNTQSTASVFNALPNTDPAVATAQANLAAATTAQAKDEILESLSPTIDTGHIRAALNVASQVFGVIDTRIAAARGFATGLAAGNAAHISRIWAQGFGEIADQGRRNGIDGYDARTAGAAVGFDRGIFDDRGMIGLSFSYADTSADSRNANATSADIASYQVTAYGDYDLTDLVYLRGMAAVSRHNVDQVRHNVGGAGGPTARSDFDALQTTFRAQMGQTLPGYGGSVLRPHMLANWSHYSADGYTESGAGGLNQSVVQKSLNLFEVGAGLEISKIFEGNSGDLVEPSMRLGYRYDLAGDNLQLTSRFAAGGAAYTVNGPDPARGTFTIGSGIKFEGSRGFDLTLNYDYETRQDYHSHAGMIRIGKRF